MAYLYTLSEAVDKLFVTQGIDKKKYFARYLITASDVWSEIYMNTSNVSKSVWQTIKQSAEGNYIDVPKDSERIFYVSTEDHCNNLVPLYFNSLFYVTPKPAKKSC